MPLRGAMLLLVGLVLTGCAVLGGTANGPLPTPGWEADRTWSVEQTVWTDRYHHPDIVSDTSVRSRVDYRVEARSGGYDLIWERDDERRILRLTEGFQPHSIWERNAEGGSPRRMQAPDYQQGMVLFASGPEEPVLVMVPACRSGERTVYPLREGGADPVRIDCSGADEGVWEVQRGNDRWVLRWREGDPWWREIRWFHRGRLVQRQILVESAE